MLRHIGLTLVFAASWMMLARSGHAQDAFGSIRCGAAIPKTLVGKTMPGGPVAVIESRHRAPGLKDTGATEISDTLTLITWMICGSEYALLVDDHDTIRRTS